MKYFEVEKEIMRGLPIRYLANSDDTEASDEHEVSELCEICLGYNVNILDEDGRTVEVEYYPVSTNTEIFSDNADEVLENIKRDYPSPDWQCNNW